MRYYERSDITEADDRSGDSAAPIIVRAIIGPGRPPPARRSAFE